MRKSPIALVVLSGTALAAGSFAWQQGSQPPQQSNPQSPSRNQPPDREPERRSTQPDRPGLNDRPGRAHERVGRGDAREDELTRAGSPFMFSSPEDEARFNNVVRELIRREDRVLQSNEDLLRQLSQVRQLPPERQSAATFELLQDMLRQQNELLRLIVETRMALTGGERSDGDQLRRDTRRDSRDDNGIGGDDGRDDSRDDDSRRQNRPPG